ncbi:hypothetical protein ACC771_23990, partial [Rhizobium ruizarguesonis]
APLIPPGRRRHDRHSSVIFTVNNGESLVADEAKCQIAGEVPAHARQEEFLSVANKLYSAGALPSLPCSAS